MGAYDYLLKINMNSDNLAEQLDKMAKILDAQKQQIIKSSKQSTIITNNQLDNSLFHFVQWLQNPNTNVLDKQVIIELENHIQFPVYLFTVCLKHQKQSIGANISIISELLNENLADVNNLILSCQSNELIVLISCHSLEKACSNIAKKLERISRQIITYILNPPLIIQYTQAIELSELHTAYATCHAKKIASSYSNDQLINISAPLKKEIQSAIIYVNQHYQEKLSLDIIANHVKLNREYLSRLFAKELGISLFQYITDIRMQQASLLIKNNKQLYIKEVANAVGYDDQFFFSRKFKEFFGQNPSEFSESQQE